MLNRVACPLLLVLLLAACSKDGAQSDVAADSALLSEVVHDVDSPDAASDVPLPPPPGPVVLAVVSDTHIWGGLDHAVSQRMADALAQLEKLEPQPEFVVITGDLIDSIPGAEYIAPASPLGTFKDLLDTTSLTVHPVAGNHDYYSQQSPQFLLTDNRAAADQTMKDVLDIDPYYAVTVNGVKFILLNTMQGDLWNLSMGLSGSLGAAQLEWLDAELEEGAPALLFLHHPPSLVQESDVAVDILDVIAYHKDKVLGVFAGHLHLWAESELDGVPLYLTADNQMGVAYHHVRVDPESGTLQVLNADDIDYGELEIAECAPEEEVPVGNLEQFSNSLQMIMLDEATAEPAGFGSYLEEAIKMMPLVIQFHGPNPSGLAMDGLLTVGTYKGNGFGSLPPYVAAVDGGPCLLVDFLVTDPCFITQPVSLVLDIGKSFGIPLKPNWNMRVLLNGLQLQGVLDVSGQPCLMQGMMSTGADFSMTVDDLRTIVVDEYCAGLIADCMPGQGDMPACPQQPESSFFEQIPESCDVNILGFGIRMLLGLVESVPGAKGSVAASFNSMNPAVSDQPKAGAVAPDLFSTEPGGNCDGS